MSLLNPGSYGGRHHRYKQHPGRLLEVFDPWEARTAKFGSLWVHDLWLYLRADAGVRGIDIHPAPLEFVQRGVSQSGRADLVTRGANGTVHHALIWGEDAKAKRRSRDLRCAAQAHRLDWQTTAVRDLQKHGELIRNMGRIRQALVLWFDHPLEAMRSCVLGALVEREVSRRALHDLVKAELGNAVTRAQVDVVIFRLYFERELVLDLTRGYDDDCVIAKL